MIEVQEKQMGLRSLRNRIEAACEVVCPALVGLSLYARALPP